MSALLYRFGPIWCLETRLKGSYHAERVWEFASAADARRLAKAQRLAIRRAANCDT